MKPGLLGALTSQFPVRWEIESGNSLMNNREKNHSKGFLSLLFLRHRSFSQWLYRCDKFQKPEDTRLMQQLIM